MKASIFNEVGDPVAGNRFPLQHCVPHDYRWNSGAPSQSAMQFPCDVSTGGTDPPATKKCFLWVRMGATKEVPIPLDSLMIPWINGSAMPGVSGSRKVRLAVVERDGFWEESASIMGLPNGNLIGTTGAGITWQAARNAANAVVTTGTHCRFQMAGEPEVPANTPFAIFGIAEVAYSNVVNVENFGQTAVVTSVAPTPANWYSATDHSAGPLHRGSRLASHVYGRPMLYVYDLIAGGIDAFDWEASTLNGGIPVINWSAYTAAQIHGTTGWASISEVSAAGSTTIALTSGTNIRSSIQASSFFLRPRS